MLFVVVCALSPALGCGETVDCGALCDRTIACEVTFDAPDDPNGSRINDGTRTQRDACILGCEAHPVVDVESAACVDALETQDPTVCQERVLDCFGLATDDT